MKVKRIVPTPKKKPANIMLASLEMKKYAVPKVSAASEKIIYSLEYERYKPEAFCGTMRPGALDHENYPSRFGNRLVYLSEWQKK